MSLSQIPKTSTKPRPPGSLKAATDDLVNAVGGQVRAGELVGLGHSTIARFTDALDARKFMPVNVVRPLETAAGYPYVTAFLAREQGYEICSVSDAREPAEQNLSVLLTQVMDAFSSVNAAGIKSLAASQMISAQDAGKLIDKLDDLLKQAANTRLAMRAIVRNAKVASS